MKNLNEALASILLFACVAALVYVLASEAKSVLLFVKRRQKRHGSCAQVPIRLNGSQGCEKSKACCEEMHQRTKEIEKMVSVNSRVKSSEVIKITICLKLLCEI